MSMLKTIALGTVLLVGGSVGGHAWAHDIRSIDREQQRQLRAIDDGRHQGLITRSEYRSLMATQARISDMRRHAMADGRLTAREFHGLREAQRHARAAIMAERNNRQVNVWRRWRSKHGL